MGKEFVNLTHHEIVLLNRKGEMLNIPPSGQIARVQYTPVMVDEVQGVPVMKLEYGEPVGLPEPKEGVYYLVSSTVKNAVGLSRPDVVANYGIERVDGAPKYARGVRING